MLTAGLYPIAMNIVTCETAPVGLANDTTGYIAVSYCSPNPVRLAVIQLYEFTVIEPLFEGYGHPCEITIQLVVKQTVPLSVNITCVRHFQKLAVDYNVEQRQYKYEYVFS